MYEKNNKINPFEILKSRLFFEEIKNPKLKNNISRKVTNKVFSVNQLAKNFGTPIKVFSAAKINFSNVN